MLKRIPKNSLHEKKLLKFPFVKIKLCFKPLLWCIEGFDNKHGAKIQYGGVVTSRKLWDGVEVAFNRVTIGAECRPHSNCSTTWGGQLGLFFRGWQRSILEFRCIITASWNKTIWTVLIKNQRYYSQKDCCIGSALFRIMAKQPLRVVESLRVVIWKNL